MGQFRFSSSPFVKEGGLSETRMDRRSSAEHAALFIRRLIFDGELHPRARVPQAEIARALAMSKVPVREALIALEREGWVTSELHRGMFVTPLDEAMIGDHYYLYGLVYGFAARQALLRDIDRVLPSRLSSLHKQLAAADEPGAIASAALQFQAALVDTARSTPIKVQLRSMSGVVPVNFFAYAPRAIVIERRGLGRVLRAIRRSDAVQAAGAYAIMMNELGQEVIQLFRSRGLFDNWD
jgi:DNA-binding GntR family transcriptional regulator